MLSLRNNSKSLICIVIGALLLAPAVWASYNREGQLGVGKVFSAQASGKSKMAVGISGDLFVDANMFQNEMVYENGQPQKIGSVSALNGYPFLGLGLGENLEASLSLPVYYELVDGLAKTDDLGIGDVRAHVKYQFALPKKGNIVDLALILGMSGGTSFIMGQGAIPREVDYVLTTQNNQTTGFGTSAFGIKPIMALTLNFNRLDRPKPVMVHINGGYRYNLQDYPGVGFASGAVEVRPLDFMSLFSEAMIEVPTLDYVSNKAGKKFYTISAGGMVHTQAGIDFFAEVTTNPKYYEYIEAVTQREKNLTYGVQPFPRLKVSAGVMWSGFLMAQDRDKDGIPDDLDKCPDEPEDMDGFEDEDGCPDVDNDKDGICDPWVMKQGLSEKYAHICTGADKCPNSAEDLDGFEDEDGCPDPDNDGDGIPDPFMKQGLSEKYAHICTGADKCPNEPEDFDGFEDEDGCPDPDNDKDGICDPWVSERGLSAKYATVCVAMDKCPNDAEDFDGFEDEDGCPDPDNDKDGICDPWVSQKGLSAKYELICKGVDKCPDQPETFNKFEDEDGCPDEAPQVKKTKPIAAKVTLTAVNFKTGTAELTFDAKESLNLVAEQLLEQSSVEIEIRGHTDNIGKPANNYALSQKRADAVKGYLVEKGVSAGRMSARGFGDTQPVADNKTAAGRQQNRRIEMYRTK
jgi:outer membrane protein OmpA-like peptidoglycan-associated protein